MAQSELIQAIARLPQIDVATGLLAVRGREASYLRLLKSFIEQHAKDSLLIEQALADNLLPDAIRHAHSLKGAAATLGLTGIQQAAFAVEKALRENENTSENRTDSTGATSALRAALATQTQDTIAALSPLFAQAPEKQK
jgi:HPt (histidine-containing phosphotransfer) domain-containing protein